MTLFNTFISSVESGELPANRWVKAAVKRHKSDLKASKTGLFYFDEDEANNKIMLFEEFRRTQGKGAKEKFKLLPWQAFVVGSVYGWKRKENGFRRYRRAYVEVPRKNGKTEPLAAGIALIEAFFDGIFGSEVYVSANKLDQAGICYSSAAKILKMFIDDNPELRPDFKIHESVNNRRITYLPNGSILAPVPSDHDKLDGLRPQASIVDEYHAADTSEGLNVMLSGMGDKEQPLLFVITTAGFNINGPCYSLRKISLDVLSGKKRDDAFFCVVFNHDEISDWDTYISAIEKYGKKAVWAMPNPSLGLTPTVEYMEDRHQKALNDTVFERNEFLTKNMNVWLKSSQTWIKDEDWIANYELIDLESLRGRTCFGGLDLALTRDITAFVLFFPKEHENDRHVIVSHFFIPEENAEERSRRDGVPYLQWIADGYIETTPGNATDYDYVKHRIVEESEKYQIAGIGYDAAFATQIAIQLQDEYGLVMDRVPPGPTTMNQVVELIENYATWKPGPDSPVLGKFNHLNNPVLRWMIGNIVLKRDAGGRAMFDKAKSQERIDGVSALGNALARWMTVGKPEGGTSQYEEQEFTIV